MASPGEISEMDGWVGLRGPVTSFSTEITEIMHLLAISYVSLLWFTIVQFSEATLVSLCWPEFSIL